MRRLRIGLLGGILTLFSGLVVSQVTLAVDSGLTELLPETVIMTEETTEVADITPTLEPDFAPTPPQLKFIKIQLEDSTRKDGCRTAAEFALVMNFGASVDLNEITLQTQTGGWSKDLVSTKPLETGQTLVLYNEYFKGVSNQGCEINSSVTDWLNSQSQTMLVRSYKMGIFQSGKVRLVLKNQPSIVIDEINLGELQTDKSHDTLVAQTSSSAEIILNDNGRVAWRSLRAHIPQQHWLNYGSLVLYEELVTEPKNLCQGLVLSEVAVNVALDKQFIEIYNPSSEIIDLKGCRLWTNWSGSSEYIFGDVELADEQYLAVFLKDTKMQLSRIDSSKIELRNEIGELVDSLVLETQTQNSSQALIGNNFIKTFALTPNLINVDLPELPCGAGHIFNQTTGSCQKITTISEITDEELVCAAGYEVGFTGTCVKVCATGYERNSETNRCRKIIDELEAALAPCPVGYYRNPETNRCRKITVTTQAGLAPCPIGYERNPETNRCRKVSNQQDCDDGYEIGFTGACVKKCEDGFERSAETNRCRKLVAQATESDIAGALAAPIDGSNLTPIVKLQWWQILLGVVALLGLGAVYKRETISKWIKDRKK